MKFFAEARTRILSWYLALMIFFILISIPAFRFLLFTRVDARVRRDITEKMDSFKNLIGEEVKQSEERRNPLSDPRLKPPDSKEELKAFFDAHLSNQIPDDDTYLIAFVDNEFYKSSPTALPKWIKNDQQLMPQWATQTEPVTGEWLIPDPSIEGIFYLAYPVKIHSKTLGVFVIAHTMAGERKEVLEAVRVVTEVLILALSLALILAWIGSGKILAPLRILANTARSISESDLSKRIPVQGKGEIAQLAMTFNEMMDRLEQAFISQRDFVNDAGHELRTPITIIRGHLELMGDDPQEQAETNALVLDELDRMSRFVDDLVLLAKAERPDFLYLETVDLTTLTQELFIKAQALADRHWCLDEVAKGLIVADRQRLTQIIINLAQNATQHTQLTDSIALGSRKLNNKVSFWVRDTGVGIAPSEQERIFNRFARAANSPRRSEGAGLGLSIVKAIAQAHGGEVTVFSKLGMGSTFTIILPLEPPKEVGSYDSYSYR